MNAALPLLLVIACGDREPVGACTLIGCSQIASVAVVTTDEASLAGATISLCINDRCASGPVPEPRPASEGDNVGDTVPLPGAIGARVVSYRVSGQISVDAEFSSADMLADGDVFSATIKRSDGATLVTHTWTATYTITFPNGPSCEPYEGCFYADLAPL